MATNIQSTIQEHLERDRPVYSIKIKDGSGSGTLPQGVNLRVVDSDIGSLTCEGANVVVIQNSVVGTLTMQEGCILHVEGGSIQNLNINGTKFNIKTNSIQNATISGSKGMLVDASILVFTLSDSQMDMGNVSFQTCTISGSFVRWCGMQQSVQTLTISDSEIYASKLTIINFPSVSNSIFKLFETTITNFSTQFSNSALLLQEVTSSNTSPQFSSCGDIKIKDCQWSNVSGITFTSTKGRIHGGSWSMTGSMTVQESWLEFTEGISINAVSDIFGTVSSSTVILLAQITLNTTNNLFGTVTESLLYHEGFSLDSILMKVVSSASKSRVSFVSMTLVQSNTDDVIGSMTESVARFDGCQQVKSPLKTIVSSLTQGACLFFDCQTISTPLMTTFGSISDSDIEINQSDTIETKDGIYSSATKSDIFLNIVQSITSQTTAFGSTTRTKLVIDECKSVQATTDVFGSTSYADIVAKYSEFQAQSLSLTDSRLNMASCTVEVQTLSFTSSRVDLDMMDALNHQTVTITKSLVHHNGKVWTTSSTWTVENSSLHSVGNLVQGTASATKSHIALLDASINATTLSVEEFLQCRNLKATTLNATNALLHGIVDSTTFNAQRSLLACASIKATTADLSGVMYPALLQASTVSGQLVVGNELQASSIELTNVIMAKLVGSSGNLSYAVLGYVEVAGNFSGSLVGYGKLSGATAQGTIIGYGEISGGTLTNSFVADASLSACSMTKCVVSFSADGSNTATKCFLVAPTWADTYSNCGASGGNTVVPTKTGVVHVSNQDVAVKSNLNHWADGGQIIEHSLVNPLASCLYTCDNC